MKSILTEAAFLLAPLVDADGEVRSMSVADAARHVELTPGQALRLVRRVADAGFVKLVGHEVKPTLEGIEIGVLLARSRSEVRERELRMPRRRYWTYLPKEVNPNA